MGFMDNIAKLAELQTPRTEDAPRTVSPSSLPVSAHRPLVAAGAKINLRNPDEVETLRTRVYSEWQNDAWAYYDAISEIKYGFNLVGAVTSRVRLYPALSIDADGVPISTSNYRRRKIDQTRGEQEKDLAGELALPDRITEEVVREHERLVAQLFSGHGGQSSLLRSYALNMSVAGECYLIEHKNRWMIRSTNEVVTTSDDRVVLRRLRSGGSTANTATGGYPGDVELPKGAYVGRIWREHPRYSLEPDSSMLGLREMCDELLTLQRMIRTVARSRMNAGLLYLPEGLNAAGSTVSSDVATDEESLDEIVADLYDTVTAPIEDESNSASVFPTIVTGPAEIADGIKLISLSRDSDQFLVERCERTLERILQGLDMPKDIVSGMANVKYCVDDQTQALTKSGWKSHEDLSTSDEVWTINPQTGLGEWQFIQQMNRFQANENLHFFESRDHSSLTTDAHRWLVKNGDEFTFTTSAKYSGQQIPLAAASSTFPEVEKYPDDIVELVAWTYTEGSYEFQRETTRSILIDPAGWSEYYLENVDRVGRWSTSHAATAKNGLASDKGRVRLAKIFDVNVAELDKFYEKKPGRRWLSIAQSDTANPQHCRRIEAALTRLYGPPTASVDVHEAAKRESFNHGEPRWRRAGAGYLLNEEAAAPLIDILGSDKTPSHEFLLELTRSQLELFVQTSIWADGCGESVHGAVFGQNHERRQESFEFACYLLGYATNRRSNGPDWFDCRVKIRDTATLMSRAQSRGYEATSKHYEGVVWCPTTANGTWFARRNGKTYFTGNSNAIQIDESLYKGHIEPLVLMLVDALTTMYLHPALKKKFKNLTQTDLDFLRVWYDPSEIVAKADPAASANTGYDNFAISAAAWRDAHGFSDTDAPSEHELAQRYLFLKGAPQPEQLSVLMKEAFPTITDNQRAANIANSPVPMPESAQELLYGNVIAPADRTTRDGANDPVSARESATSVNPGNPTSGRPETPGP